MINRTHPAGASWWRVLPVSVGTTPAPLPGKALNSRTALEVYNLGPGTLYLGHDDGVGAATGLSVPPEGRLSLPLSHQATLWAVASAVTAVRVAEFA